MEGKACLQIKHGEISSGAGIGSGGFRLAATNSEAVRGNVSGQTVTLTSSLVTIKKARKQRSIEAIKQQNKKVSLREMSRGDTKKQKLIRIRENPLSSA